MAFLSKQKNRNISIISLLMLRSTCCFSTACSGYFGEVRRFYIACGGLHDLFAGVVAPEMSGELLVIVKFGFTPVPGFFY